MPKTLIERIEALELWSEQLCNHTPRFDFSSLPSDMLERLMECYETGGSVSPEDEAVLESVRIRPD